MTEAGPSNQNHHTTAVRPRCTTPASVPAYSLVPQASPTTGTDPIYSPVSTFSDDPEVGNIPYSENRRSIFPEAVANPLQHPVYFPALSPSCPLNGMAAILLGRHNCMYLSQALAQPQSQTQANEPSTPAYSVSQDWRDRSPAERRGRSRRMMLDHIGGALGVSDKIGVRELRRKVRWLIWGLVLAVFIIGILVGVLVAAMTGRLRVGSPGGS